MHLPSHTLSSQLDQPAFTHASFAKSSSPSQGSSETAVHVFACPTPSGFLVAQTNPLKVVARRVFPPQHSTLSICAPISSSSLLVLVGGGVSPRFSPNKVILWDEAAYGKPHPSKRGSQLSRSKAPDTVFDAGSHFSASRSGDVSKPVFASTSKLADEVAGRVSDIDPFEDEDEADVRRRIDAWRHDAMPSAVISQINGAASTHRASVPLAIPVRERDSDSDSRSVASAASLPSSDGSARGKSAPESLSPSQLFQSLAEHPVVVNASTSTRSVSAENVPLPGGTSVLSSSMSISASSAGLADPFDKVGMEDEDETEAWNNKSPSESFSREGANPISPVPVPVRPAMSASNYLSLHDGVDNSAAEPTPGAASAPHKSEDRMADEQYEKRDGPSPEADADAAVKKGRRGQAITSLEFPEAVLGVCVQEFDIPSSVSSADTAKGKGVTESVPSDQASSTRTRTATILVVTLRSRAIIFELGPGLATADTAQSWGIAQRAALDILKGKSGGRAEASGLAALAPVRLRSGTSSHSPQLAGCLVALPGRQAGHVQLVELPFLSYTASADKARVVPANKGAATIIAAHTSALATLTLSSDGTLLSTSSQRGTLLRIWSTGFHKRPTLSPGVEMSAFAGLARKLGSTAAFGTKAGAAVLLRELRRGTDPAKVLSVAFEPHNHAIACASDKGTIHIFHLPSMIAGTAAGTSRAHDNDERNSPTSHTTKGAPAPFTATASKYLPTKLSRLASHIPTSFLPPYLTSAWSDARFRIPLRSFSASGARGGGRSPGGGERTSGDDGDSSETAAEAASETTRTTEGAWASMRSRLDDVRKGEAGTDEKIFLTWVPSSEQSGAENAYDIVALTTSGGWHRIGLDVEGEEDDEQWQEQEGERTMSARGGRHQPAASSASSTLDDDGEASVVLDMYRTSSKRSLTLRQPAGRRPGRSGSSSNSTRPDSRDSAYSSTAPSSPTSTSAPGSEKKAAPAGRSSRRKRPDADAEGCRLKEYRRFTSTADVWDD